MHVLPKAARVSSFENSYVPVEIPLVSRRYAYLNQRKETKNAYFYLLKERAA